eukprot:758617-Hanusia_phi.AAC.6
MVSESMSALPGDSRVACLTYKLLAACECIRRRQWRDSLFASSGRIEEWTGGGSWRRKQDQDGKDKGHTTKDLDDRGGAKEGDQGEQEGERDATAGAGAGAGDLLRKLVHPLGTIYCLDLEFNVRRGGEDGGRRREG